MSDILSQHEIDELLNALDRGEYSLHEIKTAADERRIRPHDFRRPTKFSKEHLKALRSIYEHYARLLTNFFTAYLRTLTQVDVVEVESLAYTDFVSSLSGPVTLSIVNFSPLEGSIILELSTDIAFALIDRLLGGKGMASEKERDFTEIEIAIVERIIVQMLNIIREPWKDVMPVKPVLERIETSAQFAQLYSPNEIVALITFNVKISNVEGMMNICVPYITVEPIISKLSTRYWFSSADKPTDSRTKEIITSGVEKTKLTLTVILGKTSITIGDLVELQVGDVLPLNTDVNSELDIMVGNLRKFQGKPGVRKNRVAVKIVTIIGKEDE
ncbi:MAG: flagellar motor switch protein FliM [Clostridiaceae bacterium]|nr:flagellar motor switch protein FliM [Clostridiaceae bacterium]